LGTGTDTAGTPEAYTIGTGFINLNQATTAYNEAGDVAITFASPSATMTEANFEASLQYNLTGTAAANTITGGALADTISGGAGGDSLNGGAGIDIITGGGGTDTIVVGTVQSSVDAIGTFTSGTDKVRFSGALLNVATATLANAGDISGAATIDAAIAISAITTQYVFSNAVFDIDTVLTAFLAAPSATTAAAVTTAAMTALNATAKTNLDASFATGETVLFILDVTTGTSGAVFSFNNSTATGNVISAGELVLVGVTDVILVNGDVIL
jgi:Ca2+-binding RTX toxin-like protein